MSQHKTSCSHHFSHVIFIILFFHRSFVFAPFPIYHYIWDRIIFRLVECGKLVLPEIEHWPWAAQTLSLPCRDAYTTHVCVCHCVAYFITVVIFIVYFTYGKTKFQRTWQRIIPRGAKLVSQMAYQNSYPLCVKTGLWGAHAKWHVLNIRPTPGVVLCSEDRVAHNKYSKVPEARKITSRRNAPYKRKLGWCIRGRGEPSQKNPYANMMLDPRLTELQQIHFS